MIYIIDHQDSFTWNVVHQFSKFDNVICTNFYEINYKLLEKSDVIVFSPGPGSPKDYPVSSKIYKKYKGKKKIIGICLGYQMILYNEGGKIVQQKKIYHGYQSKIKTNSQSKIYKAIKQSCEDQKKGMTTFIEVILNQELGEPFRRDAMKKPVRVAGIKKEDMKPQKGLN